MNLLKKGMAVFLCAAMCIPSVPASAAYAAETAGNAAETAGNAAETAGNAAETGENAAETAGNAAETGENAAETAGNITETGGNSAETAGNATETDAPVSAENAAALDGDVSVDLSGAVRFNTGSFEYCVVDEAILQELEADAAKDLSHYVAYEPDGRYEIQVETDAFFPYEVQFTYDGNTASEWFMTSDDTVQVGGHEFYLHAPTTGDVVTQMKMDVGGNTVTVYPQEKEFSNDDNSLIQPASMLPLKERRLTVDFNEYTPVEMTKISFASVFQGEKEMPKGASVMWRRYSGYQVNGDFQVNTLADSFDLYSRVYQHYPIEMIIGEKDQLAFDNIHYFVEIEYNKDLQNWLIPTICTESSGVRNLISLDDTGLNGYSYYTNRLNMYFTEKKEKNHYIGLALNHNQFQEPKFSELRVFDGKYTEAELLADKDITGKIWEQDLSVAGSGYSLTLDWGETEQWVTFVTYNGGKITGCLSVNLRFVKMGTFSGISFDSRLYDDNREEVTYDYALQITDDNIIEYTFRLPIGYPSDREYILGSLGYFEEEDPDRSDITAYVGMYESSAAAEAAGAANVKDILSKGEYKADFSNNGVTFSIFVGNDGQEQKRYCYRIKTEAWESRVTINEELKEPQSGQDVNYITRHSYGDTGVEEYTHLLEEEHPLNGQYTQCFTYYKDGAAASPGADVTAYVGQYDSVAEAQKAGAADVKDTLFGDGYTADYSKGVTFSIFLGADGDPEQKKYCFFIKTERYINDEASVRFTGIVMRGKDGSIPVPSYVIGRDYNNGSHDFDSYGDGNFYTFYVDCKAGEQDVDLKSLALTFTPAYGAKLYAEGADAEETSGESFHDFSDPSKAVQFTATSQDGKNQKNYFVRVVKVQTEADASPAKLYINSLDDTAVKTYEENGVVYSTREVFLDSYHKNRHDILVSNIGYTTMSALKVVPEIQDMELDDYWTLTGNNGLSGFTSMKSEDKDRTHGQLANLALVRLKASEDLASSEAKDYGELGKLTFMSDGKPVLVLTLTGIVGDPRIITKELGNPTKYVPYGTMIMNNNKYAWNKVSYSVVDGKLPEGMSLTPSGELYGVPKEAGEFEFTIRLNNSSPLESDTKTFRFTVLENTDSNVDNAEDPEYKLSKRIIDIDDMTENGDYLIIARGVFDEYTDLYIDGEKLEMGTDYNAESGSTRITIAAQSLPKSEGTHTIGVEFRQEKSRGKVKVAAQNYTVKPKSSNPSSGSSSSGGNSSGGSSSGSSSSGGGSGVPVYPSFNNGGSNTGSTTPGGNTGSAAPGGNTGSDTSGGNTGSAPGGTTQTTPDGSNNNPAGNGNTDASEGKDTSVSKIMIYARSYTVKAGDTLKSLAKKYYGKSSKWKKIYDANKSKISASNKLKEGTKLTIPAISYTVKKGDTIKTIAKKYFGANSKWKIIYQANKDVIPSSLKLKTGEKLVIPVPVVCRIYTTKSGDTLEKIAKKFYGKSSKWEKIYNANANKVSASGTKKVKAGRSLFIPAMTYTVKKGDDIKTIAKKYYGAKSAWREIYDANKDIVPASGKLTTGTTLALPVPVDVG